MRPRLLPTLAALATALALAACGGSSATKTGSASQSGSASQTTTASATSGQMGFESVPLEVGPALGSAATTQTGKVDGISCGPTEQLAYHIHSHLAVFDDGREYALPAGVGIPGSQAGETSQGPIASGGQCIYWLHTHTTDGIIHVESPTDRIYTLGNFFDEWHQPLSADRVAGLHGRITAFLNGKPWKRSVREIPLLPHALIQFDIGSPAPPLQSVNWSQTGL